MRRLGGVLGVFGVTRRLPNLMIAAVLLATQVFPAIALAQKSVRMPGEDNGRMQWGCLAGIIILTCVAGFLNPKRSHQA